MAKAIIIPVGAEARFVEIDGSLKSKQQMVGGRIAQFDVLFGSSPLDVVPGGQLFTYVNDEGVFSCLPNRAIYANGRMAELGYLSQMDFRTVVEEGSLFTILFGDILVVREEFDEEGDSTVHDCTDEDLAAVVGAFGEPGTGLFEALRIRLAS